MEMDIPDVKKEWTQSASWKYNEGIQETILDFFFLLQGREVVSVDYVEKFYDIHFERSWVV